MKLKQSLIFALVLTLISIICWEVYWRLEGLHPTLNDEKALWAMTRKKVETATNNDVVILGSSRAYFDFQINTFKDASGIEPIQLSCTGASPLPSFHDIVNNTTFNGTVIVGVTPELFFSTTNPKDGPWKRTQSKIDFYNNGTYAQHLNFLLSIPLQQNLVLISADEEEWSDDIDLKSLLRRVKTGNRIQISPMPPFFNFGDISIPRNMSMMRRTVNDTIFANSVIKVWHFFDENPLTPKKNATIEFFLKDAKTFKNKGGKLILVRCPSNGGVRMAENLNFPRINFWDDLVKQTNVPNYHFEDYEQTKGLKCPEESHLSLEDANYFTREILALMKANDAISY